MKKYVKDAITLYIPKNKTTVNGNKKIGELYDQYHDREDGLLYLAVLSSDPFWLTDYLTTHFFIFYHLHT